MKRYLHLILSLWIVYHLLVIVIVPNQTSYFYHHWSSVWLPYANLVGFHSAWQFFSPDPAVPSFYELQIAFANRDAETIYFPQLKSPFFFRQRYNRRVAFKNIGLRLPSLPSKSIGPYFCRQYPHATSVGVSYVFVEIPSLQKVTQGWRLNSLENRHYQAVGTEVCSR